MSDAFILTLITLATNNTILYLVSFISSNDANLVIYNEFLRLDSLFYLQLKQNEDLFNITNYDMFYL